jgi:signal peptidase I
MIPTVLIGDQIMVRKGNDNIARGDVVVFDYPRERHLNYVKRVVAVGGDTVQTHAGSVIVNGVELPQTPTDEPCPPLEQGASCTVAREANGARSYSVLRTEGPARDTDTVTVPAGHVYVLGDNRNNSHDSRHFGPVPLDAVEGTAALIYFSTAPGGWSRVGHGVE